MKLITILIYTFAISSVVLVLGGMAIDLIIYVYQGAPYWNIGKIMGMLSIATTVITSLLVIKNVGKNYKFSNEVNEEYTRQYEKAKQKIAEEKKKRKNEYKEYKIVQKLTSEEHEKFKELHMNWSIYDTSNPMCDPMGVDTQSYDVFDEIAERNKKTLDNFVKKLHDKYNTNSKEYGILNGAIVRRNNQNEQ